MRNKALWLAVLLTLVTTACSAQASPLTAASGPLNYPSGVNPPKPLKKIRSLRGAAGTARGGR